MVERMAADVTDLRIGDEVYGLADLPRAGAAAEFAAVRAINLALKPRSIPHSQAAALPLSALTAWQALFEHAHLAVGQAVLIHGGAGGVGGARNRASGRRADSGNESRYTGRADRSGDERTDSVRAAMLDFRDVGAGDCMCGIVRDNVLHGRAKDRRDWDSNGSRGAPTAGGVDDHGSGHRNDYDRISHRCAGGVRIVALRGIIPLRSQGK